MKPIQDTCLVLILPVCTFVAPSIIPLSAYKYEWTPYEQSLRGIFQLGSDVNKHDLFNKCKWRSILVTPLGPNFEGLLSKLTIRLNSTEFTFNHLVYVKNRFYILFTWFVKKVVDLDTRLYHSITCEQSYVDAIICSLR